VNAPVGLAADGGVGGGLVVPAGGEQDVVERRPDELAALGLGLRPGGGDGVLDRLWWLDVPDADDLGVIRVERRRCHLQPPGAGAEGGHRSLDGGHGVDPDRPLGPVRVGGQQQPRPHPKWQVSRIDVQLLATPDGNSADRQSPQEIV